MILREAAPADHHAIEYLDLGRETSPDLDEVREILADLTRWQGDPTYLALDRRIVVAEIGNEIVAAAAHELSLDERTGLPYPDYRYLMVIAVAARRRRDGVATFLVESLLADLAANGVTTVSWLIAPGNSASLGFTARVFPEADVSQWPEDRPYLRYTISL